MRRREGASSAAKKRRIIKVCECLLQKRKVVTNGEEGERRRSYVRPLSSVLDCEGEGGRCGDCLGQV